MTKSKFTNAPYFLNKDVEVIVDRPLGSKHLKHGFVYEVNYGYVPNTKSPDGEELDAYVLGIKNPVDEFTGKCIAVIHRANDNDDKLIVVPKNKKFTNKEIDKLTHFQEKWFKHKILRQPHPWYPHIPYSNKYPKLFEKEKKLIKKSLGNIEIHHFGSTSVVGLGGKGYIDIYVVVSKTKLTETSNILEKKLGYKYSEEASIQNERLYHSKKINNKNDEKITFHLHLSHLESHDFKQCIKFRDFLRKNSSYAKNYEKIKKEASQIANKEPTKPKAYKVYMGHKTDIINEIIEKS